VIGVGRSAMDDNAKEGQAKWAGCNSWPCSGDLVRSTLPAKAMLDQVWEKTGPIDGPGQQCRPSSARADAVDVTEADGTDVIDVNLRRLFFLSQVFLPDACWPIPAGAARSVNIRLGAEFPGRHPASRPYTGVETWRARASTRLLACEWAEKASTSTPLRPGTSKTTIPIALRCRSRPQRPPYWARIPGRPSGLDRKILATPPWSLPGVGVRLYAWRGGAGLTAAGWRD